MNQLQCKFSLSQRVEEPRDQGVEEARDREHLHLRPGASAALQTIILKMVSRHKN